MSTLNGILRSLFDVLLQPLHRFPPIVGVLVISLVTAMGMLLVFRFASDQDKLAAVKGRIHACIFEIRLYNDDLRAILRAQMEILGHNLTYFRLSLAPMVWMIVPMVLLIAQVQFHYGYEGFEPGDSAVLTVELDKESLAAANAGSKPAITLDVPSGLRVETPPVWIPALGEVSWRIGAGERGEYVLNIGLDGETYTKSLLVSDELGRRSPSRLEPGFLNQLLYPAEDPLPGSAPIKSITLTYPEAEVDVVAGWGMHWIIVFFLVSIVFAFSLKGLFGVTI
jgi:uncharacterized membrane protein (DUF106 family)